MSFIREERMPSTSRRTAAPGMVNPGPLHDIRTAGQTFSQPYRSATAPNPRSNTFHNGRSAPPLRMPSGPSLPSNPRPVRHERSPSSVTDDTLLGYYYSPAANCNTSRCGSYMKPQTRGFTPMDEVEEDTFTEWSGYRSANDDDDEGWVDEEDFRRKENYRRTAAERLREYRGEY